MSIQAITKQTSWLRRQAPKTNSEGIVKHCRTFKNWIRGANYQPFILVLDTNTTSTVTVTVVPLPCNLSCRTDCHVLVRARLCLWLCQVRVPTLRWGPGFLRWRRREAAPAPATAGSSCHETRARSYVSGGRWMSSVGHVPRLRLRQCGKYEEMRVPDWGHYDNLCFAIFFN